MRRGFHFAGFSFALLAATLQAQTTAKSIQPVLEKPLQSAEVTAWQLRRYVVQRVPKLVLPATAGEWTAEAQRLRRQVLDVAYHGWPREWIDSAPVFEDQGLIPAGKGYRLRRLRYQIVPGFQSVALLYEPAEMHGRIPAILNVNGHEPEGKSMEYIQKRCINQARQGILALNLEWIGMGELDNPENVHWNESYLDLAGANGLGLFYLAMRRGLDYLWNHPRVDQKRIRITGLSGGGWQTIVLGGLDERIAAAAPNAGYLSGLSYGAAEWAGDNEQSSADANAVADGSHLTAMRAPRPTLLIYNETDSCCFRAPRMKPFLYDAVRPFFGLYGAGDQFGWYENTDPGDHNYQLDNRMRSYAFFARAFGLPAPERESPAEADIKSRAELTVGLPKENLTILALARQLAQQIRRETLELNAGRERLRALVRYRPVKVEHAWPVANAWSAGTRSVGYRFDFGDGLSASGTWFGPAAASEAGPWTVILADGGNEARAAAISDRVNRGEQVLALDVLYHAGAAPPPYYYPVYDRMLATVGERTLGMQAGQLAGVVRWMESAGQKGPCRLEARGPRLQAVAVVAAALEPECFGEVVIAGGLGSWSEIYSKPIRYQDAPELFCLDLYRHFDLDSVMKLAARARFTIAPAESQKP